MTNKISNALISIFGGVLLAAATALTVPAQYPPGVKQRLAGGAEQTLSGVIRIPKAFGVPSGYQFRERYPCEVFYVAVLDPDNKNRTITSDEADPESGRDVGEFYTCKYSMTVPANQRLYVIAGMGSRKHLPEGDGDPYYTTNAWIGGTDNKPRRGYERGFAGKFVTLKFPGKASYMRFDMYYAQVDPN